MDLEKELTCSICTELLFQPLTLLDCLHTFCGACLKEWFAFQASSAERSPLPLPPAGTPLFTCPACRAAVRDTKHNATVVTLLDMFTTVHPERDRDAAEKNELREKYQPGEKVLPDVDLRGRSEQQRADAEEERQLIEQVRQMSLNEIGVTRPSNASTPSRPQHRRRRTDEGNSDTERRTHRRPVSHDGRDRPRRDGSAARAYLRNNGGHLQPVDFRASSSSSDGGHRRRIADQRRGEETNAPRGAINRDEGEASSTASRQVEHQSSLRSLIGTTGMSESDIAREVEELARQIQQEGLLDGLDLDNLDPSHHDELSRRIAQAYQRRQREKERDRERERERDREREREREHQRRSEARRTRVDDQSDISRPPRSLSSQRYHSRDHSRARRGTTTTTTTTASTVPTSSAQHESGRNSEDRSRPPPAPSASHYLEIDTDRRRRRAASTGHSITSAARSATDSINGTTSVNSQAARSQVDLAVRAPTNDNRAARSQTDLSLQTVTTNICAARSQNDLSLRTANLQTVTTEAITMSPRDHSDTQLFSSPPQTSDTGRSFAGRLPQVTVASAPQTPAVTSSSVAPPTPANPPSSRRNTPQMAVELPAELPVNSNQLVLRNTIASSQGAGHHRSVSQPANVTASSNTILAPEPSISCSRCEKPHIEYELHYNCGKCSSGTWNICLLCYRKGRGCLHWLGFGYMAWRKWDRLRQAGDADLERPHMLTAGRYRRPNNHGQNYGADSVEERFESGCFCARCYQRTNECYWRCEICNDGDWGYCNSCVGLGRRCNHPLLPLTYQPTSSSDKMSVNLPRWAALLTGPTAANIGSFRPLSFKPQCNVCAKPILPTHCRLHCFQCVRETAIDLGGSYEGDYDLCMTCYAFLVSSGKISQQNGTAGWRRCLKGHRMIIETYLEGNGGERRVIIEDIVGGALLKLEDDPQERYLRWTSKENGRLISRKVSRNVACDVPTSELQNAVFSVPREQDLGSKYVAGWPWFGQHEQADDELYFPRGASLKEVEIAGESWLFGVFMDRSGLFPAGYAKMIPKG